MFSLHTVWEARHRSLVLMISFASTGVIALVDWRTKPYVSLGFWYLFPIMLAAGFLPRSAVVILGIVCAVLSEAFNSLEHSAVRLAFEALALSGCGLFVAELIRNRRLTLESQERLKALVETSPAAIVTVDQQGFIQVANRAAIELMAPRDGILIGNPIAAFLPDLHHALRWEEAPQFRATMQCRGHRANGESFLADVWFSTYREGTSPKLAAIIADVSEEQPVADEEGSLSDDRSRALLGARELDALRLLVQGHSNKEIAASMDISESTVKNTLQQLFAKTKVRSRSQLVRVALEQYRDLL